MNSSKAFPESCVLKVERNDDFTATVLLADPRKGNPFGMSFWDELPALFAAMDADPEVRAVVIGSAQSNFTFGLDLLGMAPQFATALNGMSGRAEIEALGRKLQAAFDAVAQCRKPSVVAISGWCIGAGVELISACDVRVCAADAQFSLREVRMGMVPDLGGIQRLPHLIGEGNARLLALTGMDIGAQRALAIGLVSEVQSDAASALASARKIAASMAANPPRVVSAIKQVMNARMQASVQAGLQSALLQNCALMQSQDFQEAISAFVGKRQPLFNGN